MRETAGIQSKLRLRPYLCYIWRYCFEILSEDSSIALLSKMYKVKIYNLLHKVEFLTLTATFVF